MSAFDTAQQIVNQGFLPLDAIEEFERRILIRGERYCALALDLILIPMFDQDSAEFFEQLIEEFPEPEDVELDEEGFLFDEDIFEEELIFDPEFEDEFFFDGIPSEPFDEFGDFGELGDFEFDDFLEDVFEDDEFVSELEEDPELFFDFEFVPFQEFDFDFEEGL